MKKKYFLFFYIFICASYLSALGNPFYTSQNLAINSSFKVGLLGSKDFIYESNHFTFSFHSHTAHKWGIYLTQHTMLPGILSNNLKRTGPQWSITSGLCYDIRFLTPEYGFFCSLGSGIGPATFAIETDLGIGNRMTNALIFSLFYLHEHYLESEFSAHLQLITYLSLLFKVGFFIDLNSKEKETHAQLTVFPGFQWHDYFRINIGGGLCISENFMLGFYVSCFISTKIPFSH